MEEKKERQRKILPPLEELIGGSTSDLVSEALKKVLPYPPDKKKAKSEPPTILTSTETKSKEAEQKEKKKGSEKTSTRLPYSPVHTSPATTLLDPDTSATAQPSYSVAETERDPATTYPSTTHLIMPHSLLDELLPVLNTYEQVLLVRLYRLSYGCGRDITDHVGKGALADKCNMSVAMVKKVLKSLEGRGLIEKVLDTSNHPNKGNRYRVLGRVLSSPGAGTLGGGKAQSPDNLP
jgi:hypothetical protein